MGAPGRGTHTSDQEQPRAMLTLKLGNFSRVRKTEKMKLKELKIFVRGLPTGLYGGWSHHVRLSAHLQHSQQQQQQW